MSRNISERAAFCARQNSWMRLLALLLVGCAALHLVGCATAPESANAGKVVVVAGASSGFGKGVALQLAGQGANLVLAARRTHLIEQVARDCEQLGGAAIAVTTDVSREQDVQRLLDAALSRFGRVDVWINMAGVGALGPFDEVPLADHHRVIAVNLGGVMNGSHYALRQFHQQQSGGTLINIASVAGRLPFPHYSSYVASKHAVVGLGASLNQELRAGGVKNVHVVTINPYAADTPWFDHAANYSGHKPRQILLDPPEKVVDAIVKAIARPRPEINVGYKANLAVASTRIARRLTHNVTAAVLHKVTVEDSPPAAMTAGTLYEPMEEGETVDGGMRKRLAEGDLRKVEDPQDAR
ncbi:MAG TPA: SDR family NAD(P)-dependent oxidoreductase [Steroidobacteraceae bacterium]|nr:SDR family NAD(P)-dependent oxidoreductase [Steroidobacteraceae bacterium]